jgi:hypothetical protein
MQEPVKWAAERDLAIYYSSQGRQVQYSYAPTSLQCLKNGYVRDEVKQKRLRQIFERSV